MQHSAHRPLQIIMLPGLNGDPRVFAHQVAAFPGSIVVQWPVPLHVERLSEFAKRLARSLNPPMPCAVIGVSFGGIVAIELCKHLDARCCILIASSRDANGLPRSIRLARSFTTAVPPAMISHALRAGWSTAAASLPGVQRRTRRLSPAQKHLQQWALRQLFTCQLSRPRSCPVVQIHGDSDHQFPAGVASADHVIRGGGHLITLTHSDEVNAAMSAAIRKSAA